MPRRGAAVGPADSVLVGSVAGALGIDFGGVDASGLQQTQRTSSALRRASGSFFMQSRISASSAGLTASLSSRGGVGSLETWLASDLYRGSDEGRASVAAW